MSSDPTNTTPGKGLFSLRRDASCQKRRYRWWRKRYSYFLSAEETGTAVSLHIGSSTADPSTSDDAPPDVVGVLHFGDAMFTTTDWLYSQIPVRFPNIKICMSEGGIEWVAGPLERSGHVREHSNMYGTWHESLTPVEVMKRNVWFCAIDDPTGFQTRHRIG
jgi:predicted TIM-barrel fold metal-dependent hydrolase